MKGAIRSIIFSFNMESFIAIQLASLKVIVECHGVWRLMPNSKFPVPSQPAQVSGSRVWNNDQCGRRHSFFECAAMLKHKTTRATTNATHYSLQADEARRAVITVHH